MQKNDIRYLYLNGIIKTQVPVVFKCTSMVPVPAMLEFFIPLHLYSQTLFICKDVVFFAYYSGNTVCCIMLYIPQDPTVLNTVSKHSKVPVRFGFLSLIKRVPVQISR
jgi:hypothetical protein